MILLTALIALPVQANTPSFSNLKLNTGTEGIFLPPPEVNLEKAQAIKKLLSVSGVEQSSVEMMNMVIENVAKKIAEKERGDFIKTAKKELKPEEILDLYVPLYDKHYTLEEVKEMTETLEKPIFKKFLSHQDQISQETREPAERFAQTFINRISQKFDIQAPSVKKP